MNFIIICSKLLCLYYLVFVIVAKKLNYLVASVIYLHLTWIFFYIKIFRADFFGNKKLCKIIVVVDPVLSKVLRPHQREVSRIIGFLLVISWNPQSRKKLTRENKEIKQNLTRARNFDLVLRDFWLVGPKFCFWKEDSALDCLLTILRFS